MEKLEPLNAIANEFQIKTATLQIFNLDQLFYEGKAYSVLALPPSHLETGIMPQLVFEDKDHNFCSIFSDSASTEATNSTQVTSCGPSLKLVSEAEILSSDFDVDQASTILTSDGFQQSGLC